MKTTIYVALIVCVFVWFVPVAGAEEVVTFPAPVELQCESLTEPVGIDSVAPRFGWKLADTGVRGQKQTAYHLLIASRKELLEPDQADIWDSGKISTPQSVLVPFAGKKLVSNTKYYWKVQVFDKDGNPSAWSEPATFITGILSPDEWNGSHWIKHPTAPETKHIWFRKTFRVDSPVSSALINIASIGYHELYINGQKVDDRELAPPLVDYFKRIPCVTYDVSRLLKNGDNVIAVWTASGWASNKGFGKFNKLSCFRARLSTVNTAGSDAPKALVNSDTSWKCYVSSSEGTELMTQWNKNGGERLDARADVPDWNTVGFDDSQWDTPKTLTIEPPITSVANVQPTKIIETYKPVAIHEIKEGYRVEFAKNFTGWVNADFRGLQSGDTVTIMTSDDKTIVCNFNQRSFYIAAGKEKETFRYRFNYAAGRFVTFAGLKQKPALDDFTGYALGTDLKRTSSFACSNELYNKIYELDLWTFRVNTPEGFTMDCPHRERMGYGEVATATSWGIGIPNYDTAAFYRKIVQDLVDVQDPNGYVPHVAPVPEHQHWGGPMWCSAGLSVALEHYVNFGDERVIQLIYPSAKLWLGFLNTNTKDGLLVPYLGPPKFLGDWLAPGSRSEFGDKPQAAYFNNCVYAWNLEEMIRICKILGKTSDAELYEKRLADLKTNIIKKFCKPETGIFMDGGQVQQAFALFAELTDDAELARRVRERLGQAFKEKPYFDMGSSGLPVLLHYITEHPEELGQTAAAILNKTDYPGYGYFIKRGETAHPEDWKVDVPSRMHTCYTGIASWFIKSLGGIRPDPEKPGYQSFIVQPVFAEGTDWAETSVESPYGKIVSRWERKGQTIELSVSVPPNSTAKIVIPSKNGNKPVVVESGKHQFSVENVHGK